MRPYTVNSDGSLSLHLSTIEAEALRNVGLELLASLEEPEGDDLRRLFPPAYADDDTLQQEFSSMTRDDLMQRKRNDARALVGVIDGGKKKRGVWSARLSLEDVQAWTGAINDARLLLGTRLDVSEDMDHTPRDPGEPNAAAFNLYLYLGGMQDLLVEFLIEQELGG